MTRILTVVGARPQFVKAAVVSRALYAQDISEILVHTGQHYDPQMSEIFFAELEMSPPAYNLGIGGGSHGEQTGRMLPAIEAVLNETRPDLLLVYGDTNSTLAGSLAAAKLHIPIAHVEAGLRSFNRRMPEEINRIVADTLADILFAPTEAARANLANEGIPSARVHVVGDVMYDIALQQQDRAREKSRILQSLGLSEGRFLLATIHRAENTDHPARFATIVDALCELAEQLPVVWPVHPRTREHAELLRAAGRGGGRLQLIEPVGYLDMVRLESGAAVIVTDSGGVQKEAFFHRVPCVTVRAETEWTELVQMGWNRLAPPGDVATIVKTTRQAIGTLGTPGRPYGDGDAARRIAQLLMA